MSRLTRLGFIDVRRTSNPVRRRVRSRGIPPALEKHEIFYTEQPREAAELIGKALSPATLTRGDLDAQRFAASLHGVRLRDVSMLYVDLAIAATLDIPSMGSYFAVHMPTNGRAVCMQDGRTFEANPIRALVTSPGMPLTMRFDHDSPQLVIRIEQAALERHLTRMLGGSLSRPIVFEPEMNLAADAAMRWHGAIQLLHTEVYYEGSLVQRGQGIGALEELVMSSLLLLQPSNHLAQLTGETEQPGRRVVRAALDYIEEHLGERITMSDIAKNVHMSVRAVQQGFREELGTTPTVYLRDRRLERARADLTDAEPSDGVTVTDIAERWGFSHLGSFAALYRKRWGESPSETLRR
ncbi:AraC family transcriptional regulator [Pseudonocardia asaccharolytica]|uniref:Transcriptional regulator n=1 Tax=Pseudonocardia asaccharolytica DSM 44247 = NBRC 16224 TaxID=1123024 RepID=A0A511D542_9PSEU|nr:AraC family transcriptional regulator [Pseudonocardia asaccharolytica]GEL19891.1 transcriptional regulator [Pseudonocardia asaccharolytica DSM 44247 = NBRC 16224]